MHTRGWLGPLDFVISTLDIHWDVRAGDYALFTTGDQKRLVILNGMWCGLPGSIVSEDRRASWEMGEEPSETHHGERSSHTQHG